LSICGPDHVRRSRRLDAVLLETDEIGDKSEELIRNPSHWAGGLYLLGVECNSQHNTVANQLSDMLKEALIKSTDYSVPSAVADGHHSSDDI